MAGPQFAHIQTFARKANKAGQSVAQIVAEATRDPAYSAHVDDPRPPRVIVGDPETFQAEHDEHVARRAVPVMVKGKVHFRAIRQDRHTMASVVMSYPVPRSAIRTDEDRAALARWEARNLDWLRARYGDQLRVLMAHDDEQQPHLHAWLLPDDPGADATTLHPGKVAKRDAEELAKQEGISPREAVKIGDRALKERMTLWQDQYHQAVGAPEGLTRTGPKRRRLTREQWKADKAAAKATAAARATAEAEAAAIRDAAASAARRTDVQGRWDARRTVREAARTAAVIRDEAMTRAARQASAFDALAVAASSIMSGEPVPDAARDALRSESALVFPSLKLARDIAANVHADRAAIATHAAALAQAVQGVERERGRLAGVWSTLRGLIPRVRALLTSADTAADHRAEARKARAGIVAAYPTVRASQRVVGPPPGVPAEIWAMATRPVASAPEEPPEEPAAPGDDGPSVP